MQTVTKPSEGTSDALQVTATPTRRSWWFVGLVAVIALVLGAVGGALLTDGGGDDPAVVSADGGDLTARQEEMVVMVGAYVAAWQATDGDRAASYMGVDGYLEYIGEGWVFSVSDGSLQDRISNGPYSSMRRVGPMVVYGNRVVLFGTVESVGADWLSVIEFTSSGELEIVSESIEHW